MPVVGSGPSTVGLLGFETVQGVLPGTPAADKLPFRNINLNPNVPDFTDDAMDGTSEPREWVAGKFGADGSFGITGSRESMGPLMKATFGLPVTYGSTGSYDHYFQLSSSLAPSFFFEQGHSDVTEYHVWLGNQISSWRQACTFQGLFQPDFGVIGLSMTPFGASQITGTITDRTGSRALNYITATVEEGGATIAYLKTVNWNLDLHLERLGAMDGTRYGYVIARNALASLGVDLTAHFLDSSLVTKGINGTETSIVLKAPAVETGHGFKAWLPTGKYKPFGINASGAASLEQRFSGMFYRNSAALVAAETMSKGFTTVTVVNSSNDALVIIPDGGSPQSFDLVTGSNTPKSVADLVNATATGFTAFVELDDPAGLATGAGRVGFRSTTKGPTGSIQVDASSTSETLLGLHNSLVTGFRAAMLVRVTNAVSSYA